MKDFPDIAQTNRKRKPAGKSLFIITLLLIFRSRGQKVWSILPLNLMPTSWATNITGTCNHDNFLGTGTGWWKIPCTLQAVSLVHPKQGKGLAWRQKHRSCSAGLRDRNSALDLMQFLTLIFFRWRKFLTRVIWSNYIFWPLTKIDCESK